MGVPVKTAAVDTEATLGSVFDQVDATLKALADQAGKLPAALVAARSKSEGLPEGRVWQATVKKLLDESSNLLEKVDVLKYRLEDSDIEDPLKIKAVESSAHALFVPRKASVAYAISDVDFTKDEITYSVAVLKSWAASLGEWAKTTKALVAKLRRRVEV